MTHRPPTNTVTIAIPMSDKAAKACVIAADRFGVEPWELATHAIARKHQWGVWMSRPSKGSKS